MKAGWYRLDPPHAHLFVEMSTNGDEGNWINVGGGQNSLSYYSKEADVMAVSSSSFLMTAGPLSVSHPKYASSVDAIRKKHMATTSTSQAQTAQGSMPAGWYRLDGTQFDHLYVYLSDTGQSLEWANAQQTRAATYFSSWYLLEKAYPDAVFFGYPLSTDPTQGYGKAIEAIRQQYMGNGSSGIPSPIAEPREPKALYTRKVDIGPLEEKVALATFGPVQVAKEYLSKMVKSSLQAWPHKKELEFRLKDGNLEVFWIDVLDE